MPSKGQRLCAGISVLLLVDIIWVASAELTEYLFKTEGYDKPYFNTYVKTSMFTIYLFGFLLWRPWRHQFKREPQLYYVDPNQEETQALCNGDSPLSDPLYIPIKFHDGGDKSSGTESDDQASHRRSKNVRFSKLTEVRQLADSQADDAILARLSYNASVRAQELAHLLANKLSIGEVIKLAFLFTGIFFAGNFSYQESLSKTEAGVVNALSSTSGLFTLLLAATFPANSGDRLTLSKLVAVVISMGGIVLICFADLSFERDIPSGAFWAIAGAFFYATYLVLLKKKVDNEDKMDISMFFGFVGLFSLLFLWPGIMLLHHYDIERLTWPTTRQWTILLVNGLIGTVFSEFLWLWGCLMTSSLIATLSLSLVIPMTMAADMLTKKVHYDGMFFAGCVPVFLAFFATSLLAHYENWDPVLECLKRLLHFICQRRKTARLWDADREQTESLIGINTSEHDA